MQARAVERADIADEVRRDRFPVQMRDVIALEEGVDGELPVDARRDAVGREDRIGLQLAAPRGRAPARRDRRRCRSPRSRLRAIGLGRTNIMPWRSAAGRRTRPWLARSMPAKPTLSVVPKKLAGGVVGPAVIGADEGAGVAAALRHRRAAMAADVGEGSDLAVGAAGHQHRHAGHVLGEIVAGLGQPRRQAHEDRPVAEQPVTLQAGALAAGIGRRRGCGTWRRPGRWCGRRYGRAAASRRPVLLVCSWLNLSRWAATPGRVIMSRRWSARPKIEPRSTAGCVIPLSRIARMVMSRSRLAKRRPEASVRSL